MSAPVTTLSQNSFRGELLSVDELLVTEPDGERDHPDSELVDQLAGRSQALSVTTWMPGISPPCRFPARRRSDVSPAGLGVGVESATAGISRGRLADDVRPASLAVPVLERAERERDDQVGDRSEQRLPTTNATGQSRERISDADRLEPIAAAATSATVARRTRPNGRERLAQSRPPRRDRSTSKATTPAIV